MIRHASRALRQRLGPDFARVSAAVALDEGAGTQIAPWIMAALDKDPKLDLEHVTRLIVQMAHEARVLHQNLALMVHVEPGLESLKLHADELNRAYNARRETHGDESLALFTVHARNVVETLNFDAAAYLHGASSKDRYIPWCGGNSLKNYNMYGGSGLRRFVVMPNGPQGEVVINGQDIPWSKRAYVMSVDAQGQSVRALYDAYNNPVGANLAELDRFNRIIRIVRDATGLPLQDLREERVKWYREGITNPQSWIDIGVHDPVVAGHWSQRDITPEQAALFIRLDFNPYPASVLIAHGVTTEKDVQAWRGNQLSAERIATWVSLGYSAEDYASFHAIGLSDTWFVQTQSKQPPPRAEFETYPHILRAVLNRHNGFDTKKRWLLIQLDDRLKSLGDACVDFVADLSETALNAEAIEDLNAAQSLSVVEAWWSTPDSIFDSADRPTLIRHQTTPQKLQVLVDSGVDPKDVHLVVAAGWSDYADAVRWLHAGFQDLEQAMQYKLQGFDPNEAYRWMSSGWTDPGEASEHRALGNQPVAYDANVRAYLDRREHHIPFDQALREVACFDTPQRAIKSAPFIPSANEAVACLAAAFIQRGARASYLPEKSDAYYLRQDPEQSLAAFDALTGLGLRTDAPFALELALQPYGTPEEKIAAQRVLQRGDTPDLEPDLNGDEASWSSWATFVLPRINKTAADEAPQRRIRWREHTLVLEYLGGQERHGVLIPAHWQGYGFFEGVPAEDGDALDVLIGPRDLDGPVFVAAQREGDEVMQYKVLIGFGSRTAARQAFERMWPRMYGGLIMTDAETFARVLFAKLRVGQRVLSFEALPLGAKFVPLKGHKGVATKTGDRTYRLLGKDHKAEPQDLVMHVMPRQAWMSPDKEPGERAAVMIRVPPALARSWPHHEDGMPPHLTLAYVRGPVDPVAMLRAVTRVAPSFAPIPFKLARGVMTFESDSGDGRVFAKDVHPKTHERVKALAEALQDALAHEGLTVVRRAEFKPHLTLDMGVESYDGPVPEGGWTARAVEVWGWPDTVTVPLSGPTARTLRVAADLEQALGGYDRTAACITIDMNPPASGARAPKDRAFMGETYFVRDDDRRATVAYARSDLVPGATKVADDLITGGSIGVREVRLKPEARVLRPGDEAWVSMFEGGGLPALVDVVRKAVDGGYDAVRIGEALAILSGVAIAEQDSELRQKRLEQRKRQRGGWLVA